MLEPGSRNIAAIPFSRMRRRAFSMRASRSVSVIGTGAGVIGRRLSTACGSVSVGCCCVGCVIPSASEGSALASPATAAAPVSAEFVTNVRLFIVLWFDSHDGDTKYAVEQREFAIHVGVAALVERS